MVLRAGKPSIVLPQVTCQELFGRRLVQERLAAGLLEASTLSAKDLAALIGAKLNDMVFNVNGTLVSNPTPPNAAANSVLKSADLIEQFRLQGYEPVGGTPAEATAWIKAEVMRWTNVIRDAGIEPM